MTHEHACTHRCTAVSRADRFRNAYSDNPADASAHRNRQLSAVATPYHPGARLALQRPFVQRAHSMSMKRGRILPPRMWTRDHAVPRPSALTSKPNPPGGGPTPPGWGPPLWDGAPPLPPARVARTSSLPLTSSSLGRGPLTSRNAPPSAQQAIGPPRPPAAPARSSLARAPVAPGGAGRGRARAAPPTPPHVA